MEKNLAGVLKQSEIEESFNDRLLTKLTERQL